MFAGFTASAFIGAMGAALQVLAVLTLVLSKLDELVLAARRLLSSATTEATQTHAAARMTALDIKSEQVWDKVTSAELAADAAIDRASRLRDKALSAENELYRQRQAILDTLNNATKESA